MRLAFFMLLGTFPILSQQMTMPEAFNSNQRKLFLKIASSVSAPCCRNGIPVAYHESGMAIYLQEVIRDGIKAGKSERQIMGELKEMSIGEQGLAVIFTVPENNGLGWATWASPAVVVLLGIAGVLYFLKRKRRDHRVVSNEEFLAQYRDAILRRVRSMNDT